MKQASCHITNKIPKSSGLKTVLTLSAQVFCPLRIDNLYGILRQTPDYTPLITSELIWSRRVLQRHSHRSGWQLLPQSYAQRCSAAAFGIGKVRKVAQRAHKKYPAPAVAQEVFRRKRVRKRVGIESVSVVVYC